ncbi:MAG TPA: contact-dependent growth inhibition system immunity protein [Candidatus Hydrogenedentes bacterium]|nr:contact-dependent growth inhibition system immunity protein [Candidatus Hydrogenedentota bacterium]
MSLPVSFDVRKSLIALQPGLYEEVRDDEDRAMVLRRLGNKPARRLSPAELRELIARGMALSYTVPLAIELLIDEPFLEAQRHPGDLLTTVLEVDSRFWIDREDLWLAMIPVLETAVETINARVAEEEHADYLPWHLGDDFMAALLHFRSIHGTGEPAE